MHLANHLSPSSWDYWRIVLALAAKDIIDALKNKTTLTVILGLGMMMLTVEALPILFSLDNRPHIAIYDAGRSGVADELRREGSIRVSELRSEADTLASAQEASSEIVAVTLPADWESATGNLTIQGYVAHWVGDKKAQSLTAQAAQALTAVTGHPITIETQVVYPTLENGGHTIMVSLGLILATVLVTAILVPYLILEEKTTHTLDLLRVSPATITQVLLGKGLAGSVYGILAAAVLLLFNLSLVNLWGLMIPAVLAIVLIGVGLGLLVGTIVENEGSVQMWVMLLVIILVSPLFIVFVNDSRLPSWVQQIAAWLPTTASFDLMRLSYGNVWTASQVFPKFAAVYLAVFLIFAASAWRLRTWEN
ncbi:MAG: ABC transporter permease [Candidatus Promineifilaceae bacterium]